MLGVLHVDLEVDRGQVEKGLRCALQETLHDDLQESERTKRKQTKIDAN